MHENELKHSQRTYQSIAILGATIPISSGDKWLNSVSSQKTLIAGNAKPLFIHIWKRYQKIIILRTIRLSSFGLNSKFYVFSNTKQTWLLGGYMYFSLNILVVSVIVRIFWECIISSSVVHYPKTDLEFYVRVKKLLFCTNYIALRK